MSTKQHTVWKNEKFSLTEKFSSNQLFSNFFSLVKPILSRNFCQKSVRVNFHYVDTLLSKFLLYQQSAVQWHSFHNFIPILKCHELDFMYKFCHWIQTIIRIIIATYQEIDAPTQVLVHRSYHLNQWWLTNPLGSLVSFGWAILCESRFSKTCLPIEFVAFHEMTSRWHIFGPA